MVFYIPEVKVATRSTLGFLPCNRDLNNHSPSKQTPDAKVRISAIKEAKVGATSTQLRYNYNTCGEVLVALISVADLLGASATNTAIPTLADEETIYTY